MFKQCIALFMLLVALVFTCGFPLPSSAEEANRAVAPLDQQKIQTILEASRELDAFFASHYYKLKRANSSQIEKLQAELVTTPKAILSKYDLTSADLEAWRQQLKHYGNMPPEELEDPTYHTVINRLMPRK